METIGDRIRKRREALGLSQRQLQDKAGIPHPQVQRIESGFTRQPQPDYLARLAEALGVSLDWLIRGDRANLDAIPDNILVPDSDPDFHRAVDAAGAWADEDKPTREAIRRIKARNRRRLIAEGKWPECPDRPPACAVAEARPGYQAS